MILVLLIAAVVWGVGWAMGAPRALRISLVAVLLAAVIAMQLTLPNGHPLRQATGGDARLWFLLLGLGFVVAGYGYLLSALRSRAHKTVETPSTDAPFSDAELTRYARHIVLREIGGTGQKALKDAAVLVVGAGGLGSPALKYLAAAGVGTIGIIDDDTVDQTNLQRQVIHTSDNVGMPKVQSAAQALTALNPHITVKPYQRRLTPEIATDLFADYDLVLDGTDNFDTRYLVNAACVAAKKPLISAALTQWEGQISLFAPHLQTPCYQCIFPERPDPALVPSCAEGGVLGPLPGVLGAMMAVEAIKTITGAGEGLRGRMLIYDALYAETRIITIKQRPDCPICGCDAAKDA